MSAPAAARRRAVAISALRVRTLPAAVVPVVVGTAVALRAGPIDPWLAALVLVAALLIQIGTNLINDWGDFQRGSDGPARLGPLRAAQSGVFSPRAVAAAGCGAFALAALLGLPLVARGGWRILAIGLASIVAGAAYTAGPFPLAYHGLGEAFVLLFFGPVAVCGTELLLTGATSRLGFAASLPVGLLATCILLVNNIRDLDGDRKAGKRTLAVRLGRAASRGLYVGVLGLALASPALLVRLRLTDPLALIALASVPLAVAPARRVLRREDGPPLNAALAGTARLHLAFGVLLAAGIAW